MKSREQLEIVMPVSSSWMSYAPQGVKGLDDDHPAPPFLWQLTHCQLVILLCDMMPII
jgi:hypothetical protein